MESVILETHKKLLNKEITSDELIQETLKKSNLIQSELNPFVTICDVKGTSVNDNPLSGIPYVAKDNLSTENVEAVKLGLTNLEKHVENLQQYGVPVVVTLNKFITDTDAEVNIIKEYCDTHNCDFALSEVWEHGGDGGIELAKAVLNTLETKESNFKVLYDTDLSIKDKIETIANKID